MEDYYLKCMKTKIDIKMKDAAKVILRNKFRA